MSKSKLNVLTVSNYKSLFAGAGNLLDTVYGYYPVIRPDFDKNIGSVISFYRSIGQPSEKFYSKYLKDISDIDKLAETDLANRQVIFALSDSYFIACVWYNIFELTVGFISSNDRIIGKNNEQLAKYTKNLIKDYTLGSATYMTDDRDIGKEIGSAWLSYESLVTDSLSYFDFSPMSYHKLVNVALVKKLGLSEIYQERGQ